MKDTPNYGFLEQHMNKYVGVNIDNTDRPVMGRLIKILHEVGWIELEKFDSDRTAHVKIKSMNAIEDLKEEEEEKESYKRGNRRY